MLIQDLVVKLGAPNEAALSAAMDSFGLTIDDLNNSPDYQNALTDFFAKASAMTTTGESKPVAKKRGRKSTPLKSATSITADAVNKAGSDQMAIVANRVNESKLEKFTELASQLTAGADAQSDAIAALVLSYSGIVDQMAAEKINRGLESATPGFCWNPQSNSVADRTQAILEGFGVACEAA